jgi:Putative Ig domain
VRFVKVIFLTAVVSGVIAVSAFGFAIVVEPLPIGVVGTPYKYVPEIHGGGAPFLFYLEGGRLPQGMHIGTDDACICGTPQESGTFVFNLLGYTGVDGPQPWDHTDSPDFTLNVRPKVTIDTTSLTNAAVGVPYKATLTATGAGDFALEWSLTTGSLPAGLTLASDGTISGTPTTVGTSFFTVRVKDQDGGPRSVSQALTLAVVAPLSASASPPPPAEVGRPFETNVAATGGVAPLTWTATGLPSGLTMNSAAGVITGKPTAAGTFPVQATVTDAGGLTATVGLTIKVAPALALVTTRLRGGKVGSSYSQKLRAIGGVPARSWRVALGKMPPGVRLEGSTGALAGTPRKAGTFRFRIRVTDSLHATSVRSYALTVKR